MFRAIAAVLFMIKEELVKGVNLLLSNATSSKVKSKLGFKNRMVLKKKIK